MINSKWFYLFHLLNFGPENGSLWSIIVVLMDQNLPVLVILG